MTDPIRLAAADALANAEGSPQILVGFDGFLDTITSAVETRHSMGADDYDAMRTIGVLADRIASAAGGRSINIELRRREIRAGGNGPLLAGALAGLGARVTLIGALGDVAPEPVHDEYRALIGRCEEAISIAPSARTDALEFDDGKVMFNWSANLDPIDWGYLISRVGLDRLTELCARSDVIATINWTNMGGLPSIWRGLRDEILPKIESKPSIFVDISDPAKRTDQSMREMLDDLRSLNAMTPVTLGLNAAEARRVSLVSMGDAIPQDCEEDSMIGSAQRLRETLGLSCLLVHTRGAVAGAEVGSSACVRTRVTARPMISTGAGDHFNGGYVAARGLGLGLSHALACGCETASEYVSGGVTPDRETLIAVLRSSIRDLS